MQILGITLQNALMITGFVFIMMLVIEYLNVLTRGKWNSVIARWKWGQLLFSSFLGVTPGCLGAYAVVSLYMHRVITIGAVVATMIATSGDESFVMLALFPKRALMLFGILFVLGILAGFLTDLLTKARRTQTTAYLDHYAPSHPEEQRCVPFSKQEIITQWKSCTAHRGWLTLLLVLFVSGVLSGKIGDSHDSRTTGHSPNTQPQTQKSEITTQNVQQGTDDHAEAGSIGEGNWVRVTLLLAGLIGLFIVVTVPDHFLDEHLWNHIARVHIWRIFLWTFGALLLVHVLLSHAGTEALIRQGKLPILLLACLIGIIPESGPHLIFVTLYAQGAVPFSVLLASSIVQDGHGMIPLLAHSRRAFVAVKAINLAIGLLFGLLGHVMGW